MNTGSGSLIPVYSPARSITVHILLPLPLFQMTAMPHGIPFSVPSVPNLMCLSIFLLQSFWSTMFLPAPGLIPAFRTVLSSSLPMNTGSGSLIPVYSPARSITVHILLPLPLFQMTAMPHGIPFSVPSVPNLMCLSSNFCLLYSGLIYQPNQRIATGIVLPLVDPSQLTADVQNHLSMPH